MLIPSALFPCRYGLLFIPSGTPLLHIRKQKQGPPCSDLSSTQSPIFQNNQKDNLSVGLLGVVLSKMVQQMYKNTHFILKKHILCVGVKTLSPRYILNVNMVSKSLLICRSCNLYAFHSTAPISSGDSRSWLMGTHGS